MAIETSAPDPAIKALMARMPEIAHTANRPLSTGELSYAMTRSGGGMADPSTVVSLVCSQGHIITDDDVILACAALRLRHPLLASKLTLVGVPQFTVNAPTTEAHAVRAAKEQIEFHTFDDQDAAVLALRDAWLAFDLDNALDVRERTCAIWWGRDVADPQSGKYVFGLITTHFVTDNRRRLNLVRQFLQLLASPGRAKAELDSYFATGSRPAPVIPIPTEQFQPKPSGDESEVLRGQVAYDELVTRYANEPMSGIIPDGSLRAPLRPRIVRKVWSAEETARILRACKAHSVTVTHLVNVAGALSSVYPSLSAAAAPASEFSYCFDFFQAIDVAAKAAGKAETEMETVVRMDLYPVVLRVTRAQIVDSANEPEGVWDIARLYKEQNDAFLKSPYFWHLLAMHSVRVTESYQAMLAGKPSLPFMSSLGDLKTLLPARYPVHPPAASSNGGSDPGATGAEIRITDNWTAGRVDPLSLAVHLFTFDGRLHLQCRYNVSFMSDALVVPWFDCLIEIVSRAVESVPGGLEAHN